MMPLRHSAELPWRLVAEHQSRLACVYVCMCGEEAEVPLLGENSGPLCTTECVWVRLSGC